jgi:hypothetical protein
MTLTPDYEKAATKAVEILIEHNIGIAPVDPLPILKKTPGVLVMTFEEMSNKANMERKELMDMFGCENQDAVTTAYVNGNNVHYVVAYNRLLSSRIVERALARELGHIVLGHNGDKLEKIRQDEAKCFAHNLLCPRPLIHALQAMNIRITTELLGNITGFYDHCLTCLRRQPEVHVKPELNRKVREQFKPYIFNLFEFQRYAALKDGSALADLGTYMDGYEE